MLKVKLERFTEVQPHEIVATANKLTKPYESLIDFIMDVDSEVGDDSFTEKLVIELLKSLKYAKGSRVYGNYEAYKFIEWLEYGE